VRDRVEVVRQISVYHVGVAPAHEPVHFLDRVGRTTCGPIAISTVLEVRLKDRFQHELGGGLNHPVPDRRDAERALSTPRLRDHHPPHRRRPVGLRGQVLVQSRQPPFQTRRFNRREGHLVHPGCARIVAGQRMGVAKNVLSVNLVVEQVEAEGRFRLRLTIQLPLKAPDLFRCCKAHRQSPRPRRLRKHARSQGPSLHRSYPASAVP
jgi:hypothetical protein